MEKIVRVFVFTLLVGCHQTLEFRVRTNGSTIPRNHREEVIFDYFEALQEQRYADAYKFRGRDASSLELFIEVHASEHESLATQISIGEEIQIDPEDERCGYAYTVYAAKPKIVVLSSGQLSLYSQPDEPETCLIYYNSAFGSAP